MDNVIENIRIDSRSSKPIYQQISEQLQRLIATEQIKAGEHLPSVRHLGSLLEISPNTVAKAYLDLERKQVVFSKRGGGTIVASGMDAPAMREARQKHLFDNVNNDIIKMLSQGYRSEELAAAFYTCLERWHEQKRVSTAALNIKPFIQKEDKSIRIVGSHDSALNILVAIFKQRVKDTQIQLNEVGSVGGLIALEENRADIAGAHLLDEATGEYNLPFIQRILPGREIVVVNLVFRIQGLMFAAGNPKQVTGFQDLLKPDIVFINRQKGSGTRVLLDMNLKRQGIPSHEITGYDAEANTHLAVGLAIAQGKADLGLGIEAAARSIGLDFLPLFKERYDLVIPEPTYRSQLLAPFLEIINSEDFKKVVNKIDGYDTSQTGVISSIS